MRALTFKGFPARWLTAKPPDKNYSSDLTTVAKPHLHQSAQTALDRDAKLAIVRITAGIDSQATGNALQDYVALVRARRRGGVHQQAQLTIAVTDR